MKKITGAKIVFPLKALDARMGYMMYSKLIKGIKVLNSRINELKLSRWTGESF